MMNNYSVLCNMYYQGTVRHDTMGSLKTKNHVIDVIREEAHSFLDIQYEYRCLLIFKDLVGREVFRLNINEGQVQVLIDNINIFVYESYDELYCLSNIVGNNINESYSVKLSWFLPDNNINCGIPVDENDEHNILIQVISYNSILNRTSIVFTTVLTLDELDNLSSLMYFIYLIDLEAERRGIFSV